MNKPQLLTKIREHYLIKKYFYKWYENAVNINNLESFVQIHTEDNGQNPLRFYQEGEKMIAVEWNKKNKKLDEIMMREYRCDYEELHYKKSLFWVDIAKKKFKYRRGKKMQLFTKMGYCGDYFTVYHCEEPRKFNDIWIGEDGIISLGCYNYPVDDKADPAYVRGDDQFKVITDVTHLANEKWLRDSEEEEEEREYTIEKHVVGMGFMSFYDKKDMLEQITYCKNGWWKLKGTKVRDLEGELCITDDEYDDSW